MFEIFQQKLYKLYLTRLKMKSVSRIKQLDFGLLIMSLKFENNFELEYFGPFN